METDNIERLLNSPEMKRHLTNIKQGDIYSRFYSLSIVKNHLQNEFQNPLNENPGTLLNEIARLHKEQLNSGEELNKKFFKLEQRVHTLFDTLVYEDKASINEFSLKNVINLKPENYDFTELKGTIENLISRLSKDEKLCFLEFFKFENSLYFQESERYRPGAEFNPESRYLLINRVWGIDCFETDILKSELLSCLEIPINIYNYPLNQIRDKIEATNPDQDTTRGSDRPGNSQKLVWTKEAATFYRIIKALIETGCFGEIGKGKGKTSEKLIIDRMNEIIKPETVSMFSITGYHNLNLYANDKELFEIIEKLKKYIKNNPAS